MNKDEIKQLKENNCYVYRHIRNDTDEVFYIGIGVTPLFKRAYSKHNRNNYWKNIVKFTDYTVEILIENVSWLTACEKEIEFITLYGRKDLKLGTLVNMTNGGEGTIGYIPSDATKKKQRERMKGKNHYFYGKKFTIEHCKKISDSNKGRGLGDKNSFYGKTHSDETKLKMSKVHKGKKISDFQLNIISIRMTRGKHPLAKLILDTETGIFYDCIRDAADVKNINYSTLNGFLKGRYKNKTSFIYA